MRVCVAGRGHPKNATERRSPKASPIPQALVFRGAFGARRSASLFLAASLLIIGNMAGAARAASPHPTSSIFFVATNGNDSWSGTLPAPNRSKKDGPFATLPRALQAARNLRTNAPTSGQSVSIRLRTGSYFPEEPVVIKPEDSGLTLEAYAGERPILSGGRRLNSWKQITVNGLEMWAASVPEVQRGKWFFRELWVNGRRATRARLPNHGYFKVAEALDGSSEWTSGQMRFRFQAGDLKSSPTITNAEAIVMNRWVESRLPIFSIEESERTIRFSKKSVFQLGRGDPYYMEGALEFLDEPGEWYLDAMAGMIYYLPREGEQMHSAEVIAPKLNQVLRFEGDPPTGRFIERIVIRGLAFENTEWCFPEGFANDKSRPTVWPPPQPEVGGFAQAAVGVFGAVWGQGVRDCMLANCTFAHLGNYGLELTGGCRSNRVEHCEFEDLGAGGLKLGETAIRNQSQEQTSDNEIADCNIHDGGKMFPSAIGIWIGQSRGNRILHNSIHDFYYTGISIGWTWGYGTALASNNLVAFNHVHHIGVKSDGDGPILSDMGGIYTLGMQPGTRISNNLWHDIAGLQYGGWGIYFDEGSSSIIAESNLVYRTTHGGFHQHYGATNIVRNNIFAFGRDHQLQRTRPEPHVSFSFQTNIVYFDQGVLLGGNWSNDQYRMDRNIYFEARPGAKPDDLRFADADLNQWRARGHDGHSVVADPLFVAPRQNDFRLRPGSPALTLGFQPLDLTAVGPRK
jgi:hypothetical protein